MNRNYSLAERKPFRCTTFEDGRSVTAERYRTAQQCTKPTRHQRATVGRQDWALFLTTDTTLSPADIPELYALRWAIEVYFQEAKQHPGFLKEQSNHYAAYTASFHLAAIRFCLLVIANQTQGIANVAQARQRIRGNSTDIRFAGKLLQVFLRVLAGA
ncbi:MAG: transposase [Gammaproteobacteria bacterium]